MIEDRAPLSLILLTKWIVIQGIPITIRSIQKVQMNTGSEFLCEQNFQHVE